jgi:FixJ family two-component response regulator
MQRAGTGMDQQGRPIVANALGTVFIVDDEPDVCRAVDRLLRSASYETRAFTSAVEFMSAHDPARPGCIILDFELGRRGLDGLKIQAALAASGCLQPVIFLTGRASIAISVAALRAGAVDFITKPFDDQRLFRAVSEALAIDAENRRAKLILGAVERRLATLTPREREVLEHVVKGRLNKQIAADLGTVEKTVKVHRSRVMHKMGARSLAELVLIAHTAGISPATLGGAASEGGAVERMIARYYELVQEYRTGGAGERGEEESQQLTQCQTTDEPRWPDAPRRMTGRVGDLDTNQVDLHEC